MEDDQPSDRGIVKSVLESLDVVVLVRGGGEGDHGFRLLGPAAPWFSSCFGSAADLLERSPFLEDFVGGAAADCWSGGGEVVPSGIWEEAAADGSPHYFEARAFKRGTDEVLVLTLADDRHRRERRFVQHAHDEALHQRRLARERERKEILLDCIVHDLSSPLSTILMNVQHVGRQVDRDDLRQSLGRAESQAERQRALIRTIADTFASDLTSFEAAWIGPGDGVDVREVAGAMVDAFQLDAEKRGIRLEFDRDPGGTASLRTGGDRGHLERVFDNLLTNALRHAPEGSAVTVGVSRQGGRIRATVDDAGPGLSAEQKAQVFLPLARRTGAGGPSGGEPGLGLYFCKMTVELRGGSIGVEDVASGGSRFWFELPELADQEAGNEPRPAKGGEA